MIVDVSGLQAIETHYLGPTDYRGSRIVARTASGIRRIVSYDHALDGPDNHAAAANALIHELEWDSVDDGIRWTLAATRHGYVAAPYLARRRQPCQTPVRI